MAETQARPRALSAADLGQLLALNNAHATELSWLEADRLARMLGWAFHARGIDGEDGALAAGLIAFDQDSAYDGWNFGWFRARYPRFVYVDRVVVAPQARRLGLARALYADLIRAAADAGQRLIGCEVNSDPPNPASDAFHAGFGFVPVGTARLPGEARQVRYLLRTLAD